MPIIFVGEGAQEIPTSSAVPQHQRWNLYRRALRDHGEPVEAMRQEFDAELGCRTCASDQGMLLGPLPPTTTFRWYYHHSSLSFAIVCAPLQTS